MLQKGGGGLMVGWGGAFLVWVKSAPFLRTPCLSAAHCPSKFYIVFKIPPYYLQSALSSCSSSLIFNKPEIISTVWIIRHHLRILVCYATGGEKSGQKDQCRHSFLFEEIRRRAVPAFTYPSTGSTNVLLMVGKPNWYFVQIGITNTNTNMNANTNTTVFNCQGGYPLLRSGHFC